MRVLSVPQGGGEPPTAARVALTTEEAEALRGGGRVPLAGAALRLVKALPFVRQLGLADPAPGAPSRGGCCLALLPDSGWCSQVYRRTLAAESWMCI